jgi:apolipoprotein N-acyltransferase
LQWEAYNAAIALQDGIDSIPVYFKSKLVPGPEILPYRRFLFFLQPLVDYLDGTVEGLGTQTDRVVFAGKRGSVAPVICYESIFGDFHTGYIRRGGEATFIMTNDGWWDQTAGHRQHLHYASLRAIETRRSIARSANTGISCFINQRGDILQPTPYGAPAAIRDTVLLNDDITFYAKWGDLTARLALFTTLLLLVNTFVKYRQGIDGEPTSTP